eukprot:COSAG06_NODE_4496_length_4203_cov_10.653021_2_plen_518_part_00
MEGADAAAEAAAARQRRNARAGVSDAKKRALEEKLAAVRAREARPVPPVPPIGPAMSGLPQLTMKQLRERAAELGVDDGAIEAARDSDDQRKSLTALILAASERSLAELTMKQLRERAAELGVGDDAIEAARDSEDARNALTALILAASELGPDDPSKEKIDAIGAKEPDPGATAAENAEDARQAVRKAEQERQDRIARQQAAEQQAQAQAQQQQQQGSQGSQGSQGLWGAGYGGDGDAQGAAQQQDDSKATKAKVAAAIVLAVLLLVAAIVIFTASPEPAPAPAPAPGLAPEPAPPVDCAGSWSEYGSCSAACGGGTWSRTYAITEPAAHGGSSCPHSDGETEAESCNTQSCPPVDCAGSWGEYGGCVCLASGGTQTRAYTVSHAAAHGGSSCPHSDGETDAESCSTQSCSWQYGARGEACSATCSSAGMGCEEGDWGVHGEQSMRVALEAAGQSAGALCTGGAGFYSGTSDAKPAVWEPEDVFQGTDGLCFYMEGSGNTSCSATVSDQRRLCRCV